MCFTFDGWFPSFACFITLYVLGFKLVSISSYFASVPVSLTTTHYTTPQHTPLPPPLMVKDPCPIPASEPESSLYTSTQIDTYPSSLKLAFIVIALLYVSQTSSTIRDYLGGRHLLVLYLSALCMRYSQHAKSGSVRFRDPDVALVCRLVNRGR